MSPTPGNTPAQGAAANGKRYGAAESDWAVWDVVLGLGSDCLPIVSNPDAVINPSSNLKSLGKVPSRYTARRQVVGIPNWPTHVSTSAEIAKWSAECDYGIALVTRTARALDVDVTDPELAAAIRDAIKTKCGMQLPMRTRSNSPKFLLLFSLEGELPKRILTTAGGAVEFLGSGQQCVIGGLHPSGVHYMWPAGLPNEIPALTLDQFESLWSMLESKFAIESGKTSTKSTKAETLTAAVENDPTAVALIGMGATPDHDGKLRLPACPFADGHTPGGDDSVIYYPAATGGYANGAMRCLHASCEGRTQREFLDALGLAPDPRDDFEAELETAPERRESFCLLTAEDVTALPPQRWRVKGVLPEKGFGVIVGASGSGKSFVTIDQAASIASGRDWHNHRCSPAPVVYVCLEGEAGLAQRLQAYRQRHGTDACKGMHFVTAPFRLLNPGDVDELARIILDAGGAGAVVYIDTLNRATPGADENSSQDMGRIIAAAKTLQTKLGGLVMLIHHLGKDQSKGMRGHSSLFAALDAAIEVSRDGEFRAWHTAKSKDGADGGEKHPFRLEVVNLGMDEDGDPITSCVVVPDGGGLRKAKRLTPPQKAALEALREACDEHGTIDGRAHVDDWRNAFYRREKGDSLEAKKKAFQRARHALEDGGFVSAAGDVYQIEDPFALAPTQRDRGQTRDNVPTCLLPRVGGAGQTGTHPYRGVPCPAPLGVTDEPNLKGLA